ncbi:LysR family transcriptional regulator [Enterobacter asburiae]|uniref:LysR family transcriptional regulator n=2 Tax=Enterobacter asburiae TaxID=61645 RepID=A0A376FD17_ENTAS|nr:LysR family transcriptional regulator [Enterobacter asburiae]
MHTRWPAITMSLVTGNVQTLYAAVQSNQLDVAIIRAPLPSLPDDLQSRPFTSEKTVLALYRQHPLAGSSALTLSSVKDEKWISLRDPEGMGLEQYFYDACSGAGFQPDVVQNATDVPTVISLVSAGFGLALLPASAKAVSVENVVYVDILDRLRESELTLVCYRIIRSEVLKKFLVTLDHT